MKAADMPVICVADVETTGIHDPIGVCQLAAVLLIPQDGEEMQILPLLQTYCYPSAPMEPKALETHGITPDRYELMPSDRMAIWLLVQALEGLLKQGRSFILSGYNSTRFDYPVLSKLYPHPFWDEAEKIDVMHMCIRRDDGQSYKLVDTFEQEGLSQTDEGKRLLSSAHDAMADCHMTAMVLREFVSQMGMVNPDEVVAWLAEPQVLELMPHGKYRGVPFKDVRPDYLTWAAGAWTDMVPDLEHTSKHWGLR